jgi:hypothetical protein
LALLFEDGFTLGFPLGLPMLWFDAVTTCPSCPDAFSFWYSGESVITCAKKDWLMNKLRINNRFFIGVMLLNLAVLRR